MTMCEYVHVNIRKLLLTKLAQGASKKKNTFNSKRTRHVGNADIQHSAVF